MNEARFLEKEEAHTATLAPEEFGATVADAIALSKKVDRVMVAVLANADGEKTRLVLSPRAFRKSIEFREGSDPLACTIETYGGNDRWLVLGCEYICRKADAAKAGASS